MCMSVSVFVCVSVCLCEYEWTGVCKCVCTASLSWWLRRPLRERQTWVRFLLSLWGLFRVELCQRLHDWYSSG